MLQHVPFYVYSVSSEVTGRTNHLIFPTDTSLQYAFADLVVGTLYHSFQTNPDGFEDRLIDLLSAGGTRDFKTALQPFGLDPSSTTFWEDALKAHLGGLIDEAELIAKELGYSPSS